MPVSSIHKDLRATTSIYTIIRDCIAGEEKVKSKTDQYLPRPNAADKSSENQTRYDAYLERAVFYNVVKRTLGGLVGQIFARDPITEVPEELEIVVRDANGAGVNLTQLSKLAARLVVAFGRCGLFADYPNLDVPASREELASGKVRPTIKIFLPWNVINWRTISRGGRELLSLVVLKEDYIKSDDGFEQVTGTQYRVLRLDETADEDGVIQTLYSVSIYRDSDLAAVIETFQPIDANGDLLDEIPFRFIGSDDNDATVDDPPMYDLASLNIAHYRNSADYEESTFIVGQPTPYFAGLSESWVTEVLKGQVQLGARAAVPLPVGGTAGLLQVQANSMPFEAMQHKERQMVALGARLVEQQQVQRTATEANIEYSGETSTLSASADNVSDAFLFGLQWCARFIGVSLEDQIVEGGEAKPAIIFKLNTEFDLLKLSPEERRQLIEEWLGGAISFSEIRANLRRGGIANQTDEAARNEIKENPPPAAQPAPAPNETQPE